MGQPLSRLQTRHIEFIEKQKIFFVGTAAREGSINLSPKGQDSLRILDEHRLLWLNLTGSGNETAAHLIDSNRITMMWCSFEGPPNILRVYGRANTVHPRDESWSRCAELLPSVEGARQYFEVEIDPVQTSCGYAVPLYRYLEDRTALTKWNAKKGKQGIEDYWREHNQTSRDGLPTHIFPSGDR
jgi:hypothetical protein